MEVIIQKQAPQPPLIFDGLGSRPQRFLHLKAGGDYNHRAIKKNELPVALVRIEVTRKLTCVATEVMETKFIKLFKLGQTRLLKKVSEERLARRAFHDFFIGPSDRTKLIRWTKGDWVYDGDDK